jgi:Ca-activated chloride channel family protein
MIASLGSLHLIQPAWLLLFIPLLACLFLRNAKGSELAIKFPQIKAFAAIGKPSRKNIGRFSIPLLILSLCAAIIAMARPVLRNEFHNRTASGIDIMIAFDVSLSMEIDDFVLNNKRIQRIDAAKLVVDDFIKQRPDDRIGMVAFAGRPRGSSPLTLEHKWLRNTLLDLKLNDRFDQGSVKEPGTAIGSAIAAAASRLDARDAKSKIIVLITDGANNSGKISPLEAAEQAKKLGIKIYTIAIGTEKGRVDQTIMAHPYQEFDIPTLKKIAETTGAEHFWAKDLSTLKDTFASINQLEKTEAKTHTIIENTECFPWFVGAALATACLAALIHTLNPPPRI